MLLLASRSTCVVRFFSSSYLLMQNSSVLAYTFQSIALKSSPGVYGLKSLMTIPCPAEWLLLLPVKLLVTFLFTIIWNLFSCDRNAVSIIYFALSRIFFMASSVVMPLLSASKFSISLCLRTGYAISSISFLLTKFLPSRSAFALLAITRPRDALGDAPYSIMDFSALVSLTILSTLFFRSFAIGTSRVYCWNFSTTDLSKTFFTFSTCVFPVNLSIIISSSSSVG